MKYLRILAALLLCCLLLGIPAMAASTVSGVVGSAVVSKDGSCQVEISITVSLDATQDDLTFPLPADAEQITLNGQKAQTRKADDKLLVVLPAMNAGQHVLQLRYRLGNVIVTEKKQVLLSLPLLSGFAFPVDNLEFGITMPSAITTKPVFLSGYYQENIRLDTTITENILVGRITQPLKDHETLRLQMVVDEELFAQALKGQRYVNNWDLATIGLVALAIAYFCLTLFPKFFRKSRSYTAPEGITAGEVGCCLTGSGTDLSMMVLSWAQLGYLQLEVDKRGRVLLHKRMEMGNERSYHEGRIFQILFGRRETVDGTSTHYARIYRKVAGRSPLLRQLYKPYSGDPRIFRIICCAAGLCCGVRIGYDSALWMVLMGIAGLLLSFGIQSGGQCIPLRNKLPLLVAIGCGALWIFLGSLFDCLGRVIPMVLLQFLVGVMAAYGGRRSQLGQRVLTQLMGLRHYMRNGSNFELQQLQQKNPYYFYEMIPYALAMGVDRQFARRFDGKTALPECGWLKDAPRMTPTQCAAKLRSITAVLDKARYRKT